jgi:Holliday junction resolvase RusA-like endonuclease
MHKILRIKPLSVNKAYKGKKYVTQAHKDYKEFILLSLPNENLLITPPFKIVYHFGFSTTKADLDNPVKVLQDIISEKYGFDDRHIWEINIKKHIVPKGKEFVEFEISAINKPKFRKRKKVEMIESKLKYTPCPLP